MLLRSFAQRAETGYRTCCYSKNLVCANSNDHRESAMIETVGWRVSGEIAESDLRNSDWIGVSHPLRSPTLDWW
jgi:hypothetical protein